MNDLVIDKNTGEVLQPGVDYAERGLVLSDGLSYETWEGIGHTLGRIEGAIQWWRGDWLNYGERSYGEKFTQAIEETGLDYDTLKGEKWVADRFQLVRRRTNLSWSHHREVAALEPKQADKLLDEAEEKNWTRAQLRAEVRRTKFAELTAGTLPEGRYRVIYADPPWQYGTPQHTTEEQETVLESHYPTMTLDEICAIDVPGMSQPNSVLFLWATSPLLRDALAVVDAWGFEYKGAFIWDKVKHNVGYYNSVRHEILLICTKGECLPDPKPKGEPVLIDSVQSIERTKHSEKPEKFYEIIEAMYPSGKRVELFARKKRSGWIPWGLEAP